MRLEQERMSESQISLQILAAVSGISHDTIQRHFARGKIPAPDFREKRRIGWRLSTIERWNPQVAARIERGLVAEIFAFKSAA